LVEWQFRVAAGEPLPVRQEELTLSGHAFEARLYAEDVAKGFLPATGRLSHLAFPDGARADTGVRAGDAITPHYDPMIAKLVVHGPTRDIALRKLRRALDATQVAGTVTNLAFLGALARHAGFAAGDVDTGLIDRDRGALVREESPAPETVAEAALACAGLLEARAPETGFTLWAPLRRRVALRHGETEVEVQIRAEGPEAHVLELDGREIRAERRDGHWRFDGRPAAGAHLDEGRVTVFDGQGHVLAIADPLERGAAAHGTDVIEAPMPGLLREVLVAAGERVEAGQRLAVLEAMKMEHALTAWRDGVVAEVLAVPGGQVEAGAALLRLEDAENG
ncbi:biotin/lipoyl-containing protein, partial [Rhodosalinus sp.]|uniref:biotin/lipoyl-containing protein n=1 Tax=Rhodosalinus sp. TaxID=2047741 RepID=UPI003569A472